MLGEDGILAGARKGLTVVDSSTSDPASTGRLAKALAEKGAVLIDAPLTRTPKEAESGRLNTLVGATPEDLERIRPVLAAFSENIFHLGPSGAGHTAKLINNFISMGTAALLAEALTVASMGGVDLAGLHALISEGGANSNTFQKIMAYLVKNDDNAHRFSVANARKDIEYYTRFAAGRGGPCGIGQSVLQTFQFGTALGLKNEFVPKLIERVAEFYGAPIRRSGKG